MIKKRMKGRRKVLSSDEEIDPMIYAVNMIDCMLVLAVGFLIFTIIFMQNPQVTSQTEIKVGPQININPSTSQTSATSNNGYSTVGTVYKDPTTGNLILIKNQNGSSS